MPSKLISRKLILNDDEKIYRVVRQSGLVLFYSLIIPIILIGLPFFFLYPLFNFGNAGIAVFFIVLLVGLTVLARNVSVWYLKVLIITNQRVVDIDKKGLFQKIVSNIPLEKIQDVYYRIKGVRQTLSRLGTIHIVLPKNVKIEFKNIPNPQRAQQLIIDLRTSLIKNRFDEQAGLGQKSLNLLNKIKDMIPQRQLREILGDKDYELIEEITKN